MNIPLGSPVLTSPRLAAVPVADSGQTASSRGTLRATVALALLALLSAMCTWTGFHPLLLADGPQALARLQGVALSAGVLAFTVTLGLALRPRWSAAFAPLVAVSSGVFAGGLALAAERRFPGIAVQSVAVTFAVFATLVTSYLGGWLRMTARVQATAMAALAGVALIHLGAFVLGLFGLDIPFIGGVGWGPLLWSVFVAVTAAVNLLVDIALIDSIDHRRLPRHMEWYIAGGTVVTFIWLYVTVLRVLQGTQMMR